MTPEKNHQENNWRRPNILPAASLARGILFFLKIIKPKESQVPNELTEIPSSQQRLQQLISQKEGFEHYILYANEQSRRTYERCVKDVNKEIQQLRDQTDSFVH